MPSSFSSIFYSPYQFWRLLRNFFYATPPKGAEKFCSQPQILHPLTNFLTILLENVIFQCYFKRSWAIKLPVFERIGSITFDHILQHSSESRIIVHDQIVQYSKLLSSNYPYVIIYILAFERISTIACYHILPCSDECECSLSHAFPQSSEFESLRATAPSLAQAKVNART